MSAGVRDVLTVAMVAGLVFFTNLGSYPLFDEDEPKNAVCGTEMFRRGDWIVPTFNEELRTDKPILIYWLMLCSFNAFGVSEFSARFGSSLLSLGTALGTYYLGRKLYDRQVGLLAGIAVVTCLMFAAVGRAVTPDATLVFCLTGCFCAFVWVWKRRANAECGMRNAEWSPFAVVPMYAAMGLAMLAKGPVGFLLPCTAIGLFGLCVSTREDFAAGNVAIGDGRWWWKTWQLLRIVFSPRRFLATLKSMNLPVGIPVAFGIALPWYIAVGVQTDGAWLQGFLGDHNVDRFLQAKENHRGLFFYYLPVLFAGTFPWSIFLPTTVVELWLRVKRRTEKWDSDLFLGCWAMTWLVFFSLANTKLPNYILPVYPAVAVLISRSLVAWMRGLSVVPRNFLMECRMLALVGVAMIAGIMIAMSLLLPGEQPLALLGAIPVITGAFAFRLAQRRERERAVMAWAAGAAALAVCMTGWAPVELARYQDSPFFAQAAREATQFGTPEIATIEVFEPSLVYYHGRKVHRPAPEDLGKFFAAHPEGYVLTRSDKLDRLPPDLAENLIEVARQRRFLRRHDLVLLGQPTVVAAGHRELR